MASFCRVFDYCLTAMLCLVTFTQGKSVYKQNEDIRFNSNLSGDDRLTLMQHQSSIQHFANTGLCNHLNGQRYLQKAMQTKIKGVKDAMVGQFVAQLCAFKGIMLEMWVKELFDADDDGKLNHFEIHFYEPHA